MEENTGTISLDRLLAVIRLAQKAGVTFEEADAAMRRAEQDYQELEKAAVSPSEVLQEARKQMESLVACRVCGTRYFSKQEAKACQRSHEWQNKRGRR